VVQCIWVDHFDKAGTFPKTGKFAAPVGLGNRLLVKEPSLLTIL
jgi:hypothetical protein